MSLDLSELQNVRETDSTPETVPTDLSFLTLLKLVNLSRHGPSFYLTGIFQAMMFQIFFMFIGLIIKIK